MNDSEFETHLRSLLRPVAPSADLRERIGEDLANAGRKLPHYSGRVERPAKVGFFHALIRDFGWACAGATAALAVLALLHGKQTPSKPAATNPVQLATILTATIPTATTPTANEPVATTPTANTFEHNETTNELVSTQGSDQLVETDDGPAREVRYTYLERHEWSNPHTGARVYLEVPREDIYLLPVSLQ